MAALATPASPPPAERLPAAPSPVEHTAPAPPPGGQATAVLPSAGPATAVLAPPVERVPAGSPAVTRPAAVPGRSRRRLLVGVSGVAALGVLGAVASVVVDQLTGTGGGADSPEAAVVELAAAANAEDAVTALSLLPPGEVGPLVELYQDVQAKATSTGVASSAEPLAGFDLQLDGVAVQAEELGEGVAAVTVTGGTLSWTVDPGQMQGALRIDPSGDERQGTQGTADLVEVTREATDGAPLRIMTVERDGDWYVSPVYTLLEAWRTSQGLPAPDFSEEVDLDGTGADSAEAAVRLAAEAASTYDVEALLDLLSPDEAAALYQYREAVVTAINRDGVLAELRGEGGLEITSVSTDVGEEVGGRVPVTVRSASGSVYDDDGDSTSWSLDLACLSWNEDGDTDGVCLDEALADEDVAPGIAAGIDSLTVLTQEVDDRWYLSPLATLVSHAREAVAAMDADAVATTLGVPQFGGVDDRLEDGVTVSGTAAGSADHAVYEMDVSAGSVLSACVEGDAYAFLYRPDGRPAGLGATVATTTGPHRVVVEAAGDGSEDFTLRPTLGTVERVSLPAEVEPAGGDACGWRVLEFQATAGQPLLLSAEGGGEVQVTTPSGETSWTTAFVPEETGTHQVTVAADQPVDIAPVDALSAGDTVTVAVDQSLPTYVLVEEGQTLRIEVAGSGTRLGVHHAHLSTVDGYSVDSSSGSYSGRAAVLYADEPGLYQLEVQNPSYALATYSVSVSTY
ncbi:hypothetical protein JOD57_002800 [Geodermatophilus bullaregiensis]|uniref:hypothetical protein n=1 Tax=Geodermatophilus bullaregiensis TaxID=1564160 RepID=UPI00195BA44A|nr:hypothetical protein [Geodermatophilus bullaregiensis]MBM7806963.1 hypothetical protein [Geodermatophilus bullaregiensis]